ncbi:MAG TPA: hypothetical protein VMU99_00695 [Acidimicrobiales bacterium]|nr:hypothetical protein [Acidimicrobiales bacterium]
MNKVWELYVKSREGTPITAEPRRHDWAERKVQTMRRHAWKTAAKMAVPFRFALPIASAEAATPKEPTGSAALIGKRVPETGFSRLTNASPYKRPKNLGGTSTPFIITSDTGGDMISFFDASSVSAARTYYEIRLSRPGTSRAASRDAIRRPEPQESLRQPKVSMS